MHFAICFYKKILNNLYQNIKSLKYYNLKFYKNYHMKDFGIYKAFIFMFLFISFINFKL